MAGLDSTQSTRGIMPLVAALALGLGCNSRSVADHAATAAPEPSAPTVPEEKPADALAKPALPASKPVATQETYESFENYWPVFHTAIQNNDREKVASLTRFPFETRGDSDDDPVKKLGRDQFMQALDSLLNEDPGLLMTGKETQREHIARSAKLTARQYSSGDESARVGVFQFEKQDGRWWFTRAYITEE